MPYQPTNPYPYNTGIDLQDGLKFNFKVDNYDTISKFKLELYDLFKNEKVYTIIRTTGDIDDGSIIQGDKQLIQILDSNDEQLILEEYKTDETGLLSPNHQLPISGGKGELSICELQLDKYLVSIEQIEKKKYYGNIDNYKELQIASENWFTLDDKGFIIDFNPGTDKVPTQLVIPYKVNNKIVEGINDNVFKNTIENGQVIIKQGMESVDSVIIPSSVFSVGAYSFENSGIQEILFNYGNSEIKKGAFKNSAIEKVILLDSISLVESSAFENCVKLEEVVFSHTMSVINDSCFKNCVSLSNINFLSNIQIIGAQAFYGCKNLSMIECIEGLQQLHTEAFAECQKVTDIILPNSLQLIEQGVLKNNNSLLKMTIPFVGYQRVKSDNHLKTDYILSYLFEQSTDNQNWIKQMYGTQNNDYIYGNIPITLKIININNALHIYDGAFCGCEMLWEINMNEEIISIGQYAFYNCNLIEDFVIGENIESIDNSAFGKDVIDGGENV